MRILRMMAGVTVGLLLMVAPVAAQAPGLELRINPRIGLYAPLTSLEEAQTVAGEVAADMQGSFAVGLGAELKLAGLPFGIRANLDYATGSEVQVSRGGVEVSDSTVNAKLLAVVGDLVFRPIPKIIIVQPYFFAGGGLKQYYFNLDSASIASFEDEGDPTVHLGGGLDVGLGPLALNAEVGDYISWADFKAVATGDSESKLQHDLFFTVGFSVGLL